ncbi:MAG: hypothetical protein OSA23_07345 [Rhodospirillales bacterium]|nr:hypothetical protein [Rhodospirillales bacterium]
MDAKKALPLSMAKACLTTAPSNLTVSMSHEFKSSKLAAPASKSSKVKPKRMISFVNAALRQH